MLTQAYKAPRAALQATSLAAGTAALATTAALMLTLLAAFDAAGPARWLAPTPELLAMVAECDRLPARGAREGCSRQVVALMLEHERRALALAQR